MATVDFICSLTINSPFLLTLSFQSPFLDLLFKYQCIRTQKKQKVFYWFVASSFVKLNP